MRRKVSAKHFYSSKLESYQKIAFANQKKVRRYAWYRFISFCAIFLPVSILGWQWLVLPLTLVLLVLFFFLVKKSIFLEGRKRYYAVLLKLVEQELRALDHDFLHFENGEEFLNTEHFFSFDLDLFGDGSLFQFLNRTCSLSGKRRLAKQLTFPSKEKEDIELRQQAIKELASRRETRLYFRVKGNLFKEDEKQCDELLAWSKTEMPLRNAGKIRWLIRVVPAIALLTLLVAVFNLGAAPLVLIVCLELFLMYFFWGRINQYFNFFGRKSELLGKYMELFGVILAQDFESEYLKDLKSKISNPSAKTIFLKLKSLVKEFEYRQNFLVGFVLNALLLWDIRCVYHLWNWHEENHGRLTEWLEVLAEFDALVSLANFADNHPENVYPVIRDDAFVYEAKDLGHPLLQYEKRVDNDFNIKGWSKAVIVTGANMAGKSTFLRTVGVNLILARLGTSVCAREMRVTPVEMYTNMRTTDSLLKDESYFFAELKRIKAVLDRLQNGDRIFVILDEMLKGTNSVDKLNGSRELVRKLIDFKAVSLIATHDLKLSDMQKEFPEQIQNMCFEIKIENDELVFDYKLSGGVTQTMNATFLMRKMGII